MIDSHDTAPSRPSIGGVTFRQTLPLGLLVLRVDVVQQRHENHAAGHIPQQRRWCRIRGDGISLYQRARPSPRHDIRRALRRAPRSGVRSEWVAGVGVRDRLPVPLPVCALPALRHDARLRTNEVVGLHREASSPGDNVLLTGPPPRSFGTHEMRGALRDQAARGPHLGDERQPPPGPSGTLPEGRKPKRSEAGYAALE